MSATMFLPLAAAAQETAPPQQAAPSQETAPPVHDHAHLGHSTAAPLMSSREASGTSWLPDDTPMAAVHLQLGQWQAMLHGVAFGQLLSESGERGDTQGGSINWGMAMARRPVRRGVLGLRSMVSLEPWTIRGCGYPDLLASGESCAGEALYDRQHPHDLFMELAADYDAPLAGSLRWQLYGGVAGEPALGPTAFPHRASSSPNPVAPIAHHWLDATHISFGVATGGVYAKTWKAEMSVFSGREPDEDRLDLDLARMDSFSGRFWLLPTSRLALQVSAGRLNDAEVSEEGVARIDVTRVTASATYHRPAGEHGLWASTVAWGRNVESSEATDALLLETSVLRGRHDWFGRFEAVNKPAHALHLAVDDASVAVARLQGGYAHLLPPLRRLQTILGGSLSLSVVPESARTDYGRRVNPGMAVFVSVQPTRQ